MQDTFTVLNQFALSWALVGMAVFFVLAVLWVFRPGSRQAHEEAANAIFRHDTHPGAGNPAQKSDSRAARAALGDPKGA